MTRSNDIRSFLFRPVAVVLAGGSVVLLVALLMLVLTSWRSLQLVRPVQNHLQHLDDVQDTARHIEQLLIRHLGKQNSPNPAEIEEVRDRLAHILDGRIHLDAETPQRLANIRDALEVFDRDPLAALIASLTEIRTVIDSESELQRQLVLDIDRNAESELRFSIAAFIGIPMLSAIALILSRRRLLASFDRLSVLLERLGGRQFRTEPMNDADADLQPVIESYNALVERLKAAEEENLQRRGELERQVRLATHTLLQQSRQLGELDRLAEVGETSARIAHELRNPLAGVEIALRNLRADLEAGDVTIDARRIDAMVAELQRMSRLLTTMLERGRREPERATPIDIRECVEETAQLARYQTPEHIVIETDVDVTRPCLLPRDGLRQILFNLLLNAVQATEKGKVRVLVSREDQRLRFVVEDDGSGFPQEILSGGPRPFLTRRNGGNGLGLTTVERLVTGIGGRLELANRTEGGARVVLTLPCGDNNRG